MSKAESLSVEITNIYAAVRGLAGSQEEQLCFHVGAESGFKTDRRTASDTYLTGFESLKTRP